MAPEVLADLIRVVNAPRHDEWMAQVRRIGGCSHPLHLAGYTRHRDIRTGAVLSEYTSRDRPGGVVLVPCRNRRAIACPACAAVYHGDTFHLVRAGLLGGKGVPATVTTHPRIFLTLTAPGFGAIHTTRTTRDGDPAPCHPRRTGPCRHGRATTCQRRHADDDPTLGAPLCPDCYDYPGAVIWQASLGTLWTRFTIYLPRHLAHDAGLSRTELRRQVRLSYVKIVEYQRRGLVHVHAVVRVDGIPDRPGPDSAGELVAPPAWVTAQVLDRAARSSVAAVRVRAPAHGHSAAEWLEWGEQIDVQDITDTAGDATGRRIALYVAKYATKGTEVTGWTGYGTDGTLRAVHAERMVRTALELAPLPELAHLNLGRWAKHLAYRGHVASKSRRYSTTLGALRAARAEHSRRTSATGTEDPDDPNVTVESSWRLVGHGYTSGQATIAAGVARDAALNRAAARECDAWAGGMW